MRHWNVGDWILATLTALALGVVLLGVVSGSACRVQCHVRVNEDEGR